MLADVYCVALFVFDLNIRFVRFAIPVTTFCVSFKRVLFYLRLAMDKLSAEQAADLKKCPTDRLRLRLVKAGWSEDEAMAAERPALLEAMAKVLTEGDGAAAGKPELSLVERELKLRERELQMRLEERKIAETRWQAEETRRQEEEKRRREEASAAEMRWKEEMRRQERREADRKEELKLKQQELERQERMEAARKEELKLRQQELERQERMEAAKWRDEKSLVGRTKKFADAIKDILPSMPTESAELPSFFDSVENLFVLYEIPIDLRSKLLLPKLTGKAKAIANKLPLDDLDDYDKVKQHLLSEFHLTPRELRSRFTQASKLSDETYSLFNARLERMLTHYLRSRDADTDVKKLFDLIVADRLKDCLPSGVLRYVLSVEGKGYLTASQIASNADIYASNYNDKDVYRGRSVSNINLGNTATDSRKTEVNRQQQPTAGNKPNGGKTTAEAPSTASKGGGKGGNTCWGCGSDGHIIANCPNKPKVSSNNAPVKQAKGYACLAMPDIEIDDKFVADIKGLKGSIVVANESNDVCCDVFDGLFVSPEYHGVDQVTAGGVDATGESSASGVGPRETPLMTSPADRCPSDCNDYSTGAPVCVVDNHANSYDCDSVFVARANSAGISNDICISPLKYVDICINGQKFNALIDSGCQCPLINRQVIQDKPITTIGSISIQPIIGSPVSARLASFDVTRYTNEAVGDCPASRPLHLVFAIVDNLVGHDVILPASVVDELLCTSQHYSSLPCVMSAVATEKSPLLTDQTVVADSDSPPKLDNIVVSNTDVSGDVTMPNTVSDTVDTVDLEAIKSPSIATEQANDETLTECRRLAKACKGGFELRGDVLYHGDVVLGQRVNQLVVPKERRAEVMKLAHDKCGFHQGQKRTSERIRYSFYWPGLRKDVVDYCNRCEACARHSRLRATDHVPINYIERPELPGMHLEMDVVGPIEPPSSQGHKYVLCVVDVCTNWPFVFALKNLTAKAVCDCLCEVFAQFGVASVISCDNATNFVSKLTQEFLTRLGCTPRFSTPGHPECQGKVERFNATFKRMLHHAIHENARQWHKCLPYLTWGMRECSNASTSASPYLLLYGRVPRGPLAVLKETWSGERELPHNLNKTEVQYMQDLKDNLEVARKFASDHATVAQERYVSQYNKNTKAKSFYVGDRVIVLHPDSTNKLLSRWQIGVVHKVKSPHSYLVDMPDGARRHLHVNKLRPVTASVHAVILEQDREFGDVVSLPAPCTDVLPSQKVDLTGLSHLSDEERQQLLLLLDDFPQLFAEKPGYCGLVEHEIVTLPSFTPRRAKAYKIPEILKPEVDKQIETLLKDGFIRPSTSPMASAIVCVLKKPKGGAMTQGNGEPALVKPEVRLAIDYRYLNSHTQFFPYPSPDQDEVLTGVGRFKIISVFDARSGYHQTPIKPEHVWLSAFVTHNAEYEWLRTPFGMLNSGATFIKAMNEVLKPIREFTGNYVDDMAVGSDDIESHFENLRSFFTVVSEAGLTLNLRKSEFAKNEVKFIGHLVGGGHKRTDPDRIQSIRDLERPVTKKQLKSVLGLMGYHRPFIAGYAEIAKPLTDLTASKIPSVIPWTDKEQAAFDTLKERLGGATALYLPKVGQLFILRTDASGIAVAGCLSQLINDDSLVDEKGTGERPVAFCSQKLTPTQRNWSVIEREAYAVIFSLNKYHNMIFGSPITIFSDHNPLSYIVENATKSAKLTRWALALQAYHINFRYAKACNNVSADCLSRIE